MALTIDELEIKIESDASKATSGIDDLTASLNGLKSALSGSSGLASNLSRIATSMQALKAVGRISLKGNINQLTSLQPVVAAYSSTQSSQFYNNMNSIAAGIGALSGVKVVGLSTIAKGLGDLNSVASSLDGTKIDIFAGNAKKLSDALVPLENIGKIRLSSVTKQLREIPEVTKQLDPQTIEQFASAMQRLATALEPLASKMDKVSKGFGSLPSQIKKATSAVDSTNSANLKSSKSFSSLSNSLYFAARKFMVLYYAASQTIDVFAECFNESNKYIENLNLFKVTMGDASDEALNFANRVSDVMGIDTSEWIQNQGVFMQMATGFGVASDKAGVMSQNLTQLAYDMSSFFNTDVETAMQKLQSGMSGQIKGLKAFGINLSVAALQETALELGIEKSVRQMTEAERAQLRYITVMKRSKNIMGDMSRTLETPANAMRILSSQFTQFKRAIGDIVSVIVTKFIPVIQVMVSMLTDAANSLSELMGFKLPEIDYSGLELGADVTDEMDESLEGTEEKLKELKKQLMGFDEINVLSSNKTEEDAGLNIDFDIPSYDFMGDLEGKYSGIAKEIEGIIARLGSAFNTLDFTQAIDRVKELVENIKKQFEGLDIKGAMLNAWDEAIGALGAAVNLVVQVVSPVFEALNVPQLKLDTWELWGSVFSALGDIIRPVTKLLTQFVKKGLAPIVKWVSGAVSKALKTLSGILDKLGAWFDDASSKFEALGSVLGDIVDSVWEFIEPLASQIWDSLLDCLDDISDVLIDVSDAAMSLGVTIGEDLKSSFDEFANVLKPLTDFISTVVSDVFEKMLGPALEYISTTILPTLSSTLENLWNNVLVPLGNFIMSVLEPAIRIVSDALGWLWQYVILPLSDAVGGVLAEAFDAICEILNNGVIPIVSAAIDFFTRLWKNVLSPIVDFLWSIFAPAFGEVFKGIGGVIDGLGTALKGLITFIKGVFTGDWKTAWEGVKNVFSGIWDGLSTALKTPLNACVSLFEGIANKIIDAWNWVKKGINSMSFDMPEWLGGGHVGFDLAMSSHINIPRFEDGGFPNSGSLFWANEGGFPELVGRIGNKTAVANNDQITAGIASAVYEAMMAAQAEGGGGNRGTARIVVQIGERAVGEASVEYINGQIRQTGTNPINY